ncbi:hypothetical protein [uncultured Flavonifractor sp.]|uniref:hypothetical protein n=1 Tax=uncultured Flavonifractor sp. TaxID=1193534 RepID=UPI002623D534|nr:hypothetical protein [uncultured Flavonifractor sp.]
MKRIRIAVLAAALVLALGVTTAFAAGGHHSWTGGDCWSRSGACYVDADGDGVCDNCGRLQGACYVDADGGGVCDNRGAGLGCQSGRGCRGGRW